MRGLGCRIKRAAVKDFMRTYKADIGLLQETKLSHVSDSIVQQIWGLSSKNSWVCGEAIGTSGGISVVWNDALFSKIDH